MRHQLKKQLQFASQIQKNKIRREQIPKGRILPYSEKTQPGSRLVVQGSQAHEIRRYKIQRGNPHELPPLEK
jgi:hypothetical protein